MNKLNFFVKKNIIDYMRFDYYREEVKEWKKIAKKEIGKNISFIDMIKKCYNTKSTFEDYFWFKFYSISLCEADKFITLGRHLDIFSVLNKEKNKKLFADKGEFNILFKDFMNRDFLDLRKASLSDFKEFIRKHPSYISKPACGSSGFKVEKIITDKNTDIEGLYNKQINDRCFIIEEIIVQHEKMSSLNPSSVNTIRVITTKDHNGQISVYKVAMRIGNGNKVADNLNNGGMACSIDIDTGKIDSHGITKKIDLTYDIHPISHIPLVGFEIPHYKKILEFCIEAHKLIDMDLIGFDIAVTPNGCSIVEGNSTPFYDIMQMPKQQGEYYNLKSRFECLNT